MAILFGSKGLSDFPTYLKAGESEQYAFQLYVLGTDVLVREGTVNGIEVAGTDTPIAASDDKRIWIDVTVNTGGIATSASIGNGGAYPSNTDTHGYQPLGRITFVSGVVTLPPTIVHGGLAHQTCGSGIHLFGGLG